MQKLIYNFLQFVLGIQTKMQKRRLGMSKTTFSTASNVISFNEAADLKLNAKSNSLKVALDEEVKHIVKQNLDNPEVLLDFIKERDTGVHRLSQADKILSIINEDEGFIAPLKGIKAFYLNFVLSVCGEKRFCFSFQTPGMFILRPLAIDIYSMIHQFHKWYSYKNDMPGFESDTQSKFKKIFRTLSDDDIKDFSLGEIISIKEALTRDVEAINFVVDLANEVDSSKKLLKRIRSGESINL